MNFENAFPYKLVKRIKKRYNYKLCSECHSEYIFAQPPMAKLYCRLGNIIINFDEYALTSESVKNEIEHCLKNAPDVINYVSYGTFTHCPYCDYKFKEEDDGYVEDGEKEVWYLDFAYKHVD